MAKTNNREGFCEAVREKINLKYRGDNKNHARSPI